MGNKNEVDDRSEEKEAGEGKKGEWKQEDVSVLGIEWSSLECLTTDESLCVCAEACFHFFFKVLSWTEEWIKIWFTLACDLNWIESLVDLLVNKNPKWY